VKDAEIELDKKSTCDVVKMLFKNKTYLGMVGCLSGLYFIITGIQYWMSNYLQVVLLVPADEVYYYYSITCLTAPFAGVILGGFVFSLLGGYNDSRSYLLADIIGIFCIFIASPVPFLTTKWPVYILMWLLLFLGSFILPTVTGMMLSSVDLEHRATANAMAVLAYNLLGYLPAPFIYGWISTFGVDPDDTDLYRK